MKKLWVLTILLGCLFIVSFSMMRNSNIVETEVIIEEHNKVAELNDYIYPDAIVSIVKRDFTDILVGSKDRFDIQISGSERATLEVLKLRNYLLSVWDSSVYDTFSSFLQDNVTMDVRYDPVSNYYYIISLYDSTSDKDLEDGELHKFVSACAVVKVKGEVIHEAFYFN